MSKYPTAWLKELALGTWTSRFLATGYVVAVTTYRSRDVDPQTRDSLEDVLATIDHLRKLSYVDSKSIVVTGCSGGGDLALAVAVETDVAVIVPEEPASVFFTGIFNKNMPKKGERYVPEDGAPITADPKRYYTAEMPDTHAGQGREDSVPDPDHSGGLAPAQPVQRGDPASGTENGREDGGGLHVQRRTPLLRLFQHTLELPPHAAPPHPDVARQAFEDVDGYLRKQLKTKPAPIDPDLVKQVPIETK